MPLVLVSGFSTMAQSEAQKDSLFILQVEDQQEPDKVLHAEPLFIDLIRDLGARKGEREWNLGIGLSDKLRFDSYEALIEYEWAPIDRLGLEVELPFTFYAPVNGTENTELPSHSLNSLKLAAQWSFFVSEEYATSMAIGYINELKLSDFQSFGRPLFTANVYNPFLVIAKRWGSNFHSLLYTGPRFQQSLLDHQHFNSYEMHSSFHYMISGTRNFIGVEFNKSLDERNDFDLTIRPQMRLAIAPNFMMGIVMGIPLSRENERLSTFLRLIWEPKH